MYRYSNGQISLADFKQPVGMNLKENNRWVEKAQTIPWLEIEKRYAALFTNRKGNVANAACISQILEFLDVDRAKGNTCWDCFAPGLCTHGSEIDFFNLIPRHD